MATFEPVATLADLDTLNVTDVITGYRDFRTGDPEPGANRGRGYWHGWMNAARDHGVRPSTPQSKQLAHEVIRDQKSWLTNQASAA